MEKQNLQNKTNSIEVALIDEVTASNLKEIFIEGAEVSLDYFLKDGVLKEIPFFGTLLKSIQAAFGIREAIFAKKVYKFLSQLKDIPLEDRKSFIIKLEENKEHRHRVGEKLIVLLEKLDDINKPEIIGKLFKSSIKGSISYSEFLRLSNIVSAAYLPDLLRLKDDSKTYQISDIVQEQLSKLGIMSMKLRRNTTSDYLQSHYSLSTPTQTSVSVKVEYELNLFGKLILEYGLKEKPEFEVGLRGEI